MSSLLPQGRVTSLLTITSTGPGGPYNTHTVFEPKILNTEDLEKYLLIYNGYILDKK